MSQNETTDYDALEKAAATVNALALAIVVEQLVLNGTCGGTNHDEGCALCQAIKTCQEAVDHAA